MCVYIHTLLIKGSRLHNVGRMSSSHRLNTPPPRKAPSKAPLLLILDFQPPKLAICRARREKEQKRGAKRELLRGFFAADQREYSGEDFGFHHQAELLGLIGQSLQKTSPRMISRHTTALGVPDAFAERPTRLRNGTNCSFKRPIGPGNEPYWDIKCKIIIIIFKKGCK